MYRLLFVDDEEIILQGLVELIEGQSLMDLEVNYAYSAKDALKLMQKTRIDIVVTDIEMPQMNGLQLQKEIRKQWPHCKVIFLTGYDEFSYAHEAIRNDGFDFLLKTESDETIIQAIVRAMSELASQVELEQLIQSARSKMKTALPYLKKDYFSKLLAGNGKLLNSLGQTLSDLQIPLKESSPLTVLLGRVDVMHPRFESYDYALIQFAIQNIAEDFLGVSAKLISFTYSNHELVWLIQPPESIDDSDQAKSLFMSFVNGSLEVIQSTCKKLLGVEISFVSSSQLLEWSDIAAAFDALQRIMESSMGMGKELLLTDAVFQERSTQGPGEYPQRVRIQLKQLQELKAFFEQGDQQAYFQLFTELALMVDQEPLLGEKLKVEIFAFVSYMFISYINSWAIEAQIGGQVDLDRLMKLQKHRNWQEATDYFKTLAHVIFAEKSNHLFEIERDLITQIREYIQDHLAEDLSLTKIADVVSLNPSYLSRVYKQTTGNGLSEDIMSIRLKKSIEMLKQPNFRIHEISAAMGFVSDNYFYRFFKKHMNVTPHEFREREREVNKR